MCGGSNRRWFEKKGLINTLSMHQIVGFFFLLGGYALICTKNSNNDTHNETPYESCQTQCIFAIIDLSIHMTIV